MGRKLELTIEEGQALLMIGASFNLPETLGEQKFGIMDRAMAQDDVRALYRQIRAVSPLLQKKERWQRFGPPAAWQELKVEGGQIAHRYADQSMIQDIEINDEVESGIMWCLLLVLHPSSARVAVASLQEDVFWRIAKKIRMERTLRETIGIVPEKARPARWKRDDDYKDDKEIPAPVGAGLEKS